MQKLRSFIALAVLGGMTVVLPVIILLALFQWLFEFITDLIQPLSATLSSHTDVQDIFADVLVILVILAMCFSIGLLIKTSIGAWLHRLVDRCLERFAPGYGTIRDLVGQILGGAGQTSLLNGQVALVRLYDNSQLRVTAIVTAEHDLGYTVFVPTAPVPTSGMVYHVAHDAVELRPDMSVERAMKTVISCGSGSGELFVNRSQHPH